MLRSLAGSLFLSLTGPGCAPGLKPELRVTSLPVLGVSPKAAAGTVRVSVEPFADARIDPTVADVDGRKVRPKGDVGVVIQEAFQRYFRAYGADVALFGAPVVRGEVKEWNVNVRPGFPLTTIVAAAVIDVVVTSAAGDVAYRGTYSGESGAKDPFPSEADVKNMLGTAMTHAVREAAGDDAVLSELVALSDRSRAPFGEPRTRR